MPVAGTQLLRGLSSSAVSGGCQLAAQVGMTFFVPFATVALAMLARMQVGRVRGSADLSVVFESSSQGMVHTS